MPVIDQVQIHDMTLKWQIHMLCLNKRPCKGTHYIVIIELVFFGKKKFEKAVSMWWPNVIQAIILFSEWNKNLHWESYHPMYYIFNELQMAQQFKSKLPGGL